MQIMLCNGRVLTVCVSLLKPGRVPSSQGLRQRGIQVSAPETWKQTNQRSIWEKKNPMVPITDLFAVLWHSLHSLWPFRVRTTLFFACYITFGSRCFCCAPKFSPHEFPLFFRLFLFFFSCLSDFTAGNAAANYLLYFVPRNILFIQSFAMLVVAWHPSCLYPSLPSRALPACLGKPSVCCRDLGSAAKPMGGKPRPIFYSFIAVWI